MRSRSYVDAGHPAWHKSEEMVSRLKAAGIEGADGFSLNVSNFQLDKNCIDYGVKISDGVGGKHFIIDRGRNGQGPHPKGEWCNPPGRGLGKLPSTKTGHPRVDAFLWVKPPGFSDGDKDGAPKAGEFYPAYALQLAANAAKEK
jgi:endoglucanase